MPNASSLTYDQRFVGLFVGPKHSGKTVAACSFVNRLPNNDKQKIRVLDFDGRIRGILDASWIDRNLIDYDYYPPRLGKKEGTVFEKINNDMEALQVMCGMGTNPYGTLICDSLTAQTFALLCDAIPLTHQSEKGKPAKGKHIGALAMAGPEDYGFEATGTYQLMSFFRSLPIPNIIVTAHIIDKFGKVDPDDKYSPTEVVGEKLSIRDKIGTNVSIYFDHIFRFDRRMVGMEERFFVKFRSDIACTSYPGLKPGEHDITGKNFYEYMMELVNKKTQS